MTKPMYVTLRANFCKNRDRPATPVNSNFSIFSSNDFYSELFSKLLFKLFEVLDFRRNRGQFENRHFSITTITEKSVK